MAEDWPSTVASQPGKYWSESTRRPGAKLFVTMSTLSGWYWATCTLSEVGEVVVVRGCSDESGAPSKTERAGSNVGLASRLRRPALSVKTSAACTSHAREKAWL